MASPPAQQDPTSLFRTAWHAFQAGQLDEAQALLQRLLARQPSHPDALHVLAAVQQARGQHDAAADSLQRSLALAPGNAHGWSRLADIRESQGLPVEALECLERACRLLPTLATAQYNRARLLQVAGRAADALAAVSVALAQSQGTRLEVQALQLRALLEQDLGRFEEALHTLDEALVRAPGSAALHHNRGVVLLHLDRADASLQAHDEALRLGVDAADAHYNRANTLQALGRGPEAAEAYRQALRRQPVHAMALLDLARLRWRMGHAGFADELDAAIQQAPDSALPLGIKGRLLIRAERPDEAAELFARAVTLPDATAGHFDGLGLALSRIGRHDEALQAHREAVRRAPDAAGGHTNLAAALLRAGQVADAAGAAATATQLAPDDQDAWSLQWAAWRAAGDPRADWLADMEHGVGIYDLGSPDDVADLTDFHRTLEATLLQWHADAAAPLDQTLRQGTQTHGNLFARTHPAVQALRRLLEPAVQGHVDKLVARATAMPGHPLYRRARPAWRFTDSWSSRLSRGGFHTRHVHPHGWLSSVYYIALPPSVAGADQSPAHRPGWLEFGQPDFQVGGQDLPALTAVQPRVGRLVLFPSYLWHGTRPFHDEATRLTVAFDAVPRP